MFNLGETIKQHLLEDVNIQQQIENKIFNTVVLTTSNTVNPPYLVVDIQSVTPAYTKDIFTYWNGEFSIVLLAGKYSDLATLNEVVKTSLELKEIETEIIEVTAITVDNYKESFDSNFELYSSELAFSCKFLNK